MGTAIGPPILNEEFDKNYWTQVVEATMITYALEQGSKWAATNNINTSTTRTKIGYPVLDITEKGEVLWTIDNTLTPLGKGEYVIEITAEEVL